MRRGLRHVAIARAREEPGPWTRIGTRRDRPSALLGAIPQRPWKQFDIALPADQDPERRIRAIHDTAFTILEEIGMKVLEPRGRALPRRGRQCRRPRCACGSIARWSKDRIVKAPPIHSRSAQSGEQRREGRRRNGIFPSVGGPCLCDGQEGVEARSGTYAEMCDYLKSIQVSTSFTRKAAGLSSRSICPPKRGISISTSPRSHCLTRTGSRRASAPTARSTP